MSKAATGQPQNNLKNGSGVGLGNGSGTAPNVNSRTRVKLPSGFVICLVLFVASLIGLIVSLAVESSAGSNAAVTVSDIFIEISVLVLFIAGFFMVTRRMQLVYLLFASAYNIVFLGIFGKMSYDAANHGISILFMIQIIFLVINLIPIVMHHLARRDFYFTYQRQLIYPTMFFLFLLLSRLPGSETLIEQISHEVFSLIIFSQAFSMFNAFHKLGKAYHLATYAAEGSDGEGEDDEEL